MTSFLIRGVTSFAGVAVALTTSVALAQVSNVPDGAGVGATNQMSAPVIAISGAPGPAASVVARAASIAPASAQQSPVAVAPARTSVVTTGPLGKFNNGAVPNPASSTSPAMAVSASSTTGRPAVKGAPPAAVATAGKVRSLQPSVGSRLHVDASAALQAPKEPETPLDAPLPVLGKAPGTDDLPKSPVIRCRPGVNQLIPIAIAYPNQFDTPFSNPRVIDADGDDDNFKYGNSIFITANRQTPFAVWLTDKAPDAPKCSLTLVPQNIPAQNLIIQLEGATRDTALAVPGSAEETGREDQYTVLLRTLMRSVARNITPRGFSVEKLNVGMAISNGIEARPVKILAGADFDVYVYELTNRSGAPVTLSEQAFGTKGVRAVAFFPNTQLTPGEKTKVFIISDRPDTDDADSDGDPQ